eukprot:gene3204-3726_t
MSRAALGSSAKPGRCFAAKGKKAAGARRAKDSKRLEAFNLSKRQIDSGMERMRIKARAAKSEEDRAVAIHEVFKQAAGAAGLADVYGAEGGSTEAPMKKVEGFIKQRLLGKGDKATAGHVLQELIKDTYPGGPIGTVDGTEAVPISVPDPLVTSALPGRDPTAAQQADAQVAQALGASVDQGRVDTCLGNLDRMFVHVPALEDEDIKQRMQADCLPLIPHTALPAHSDMLTSPFDSYSSSSDLPPPLRQATRGGVEGWAHHRVVNVVGEGEELQLGLQNVAAWGSDPTSTVSAEVLGTGLVRQMDFAEDAATVGYDQLEGMLKDAINNGVAQLRKKSEPAVESWWQEQSLAYAVDAQSADQPTDLHQGQLQDH